MFTAKVFENGRSQAVRLPKEFRFESDRVSVNKIGDVVMLFPENEKWSSFEAALKLFSDDFMKNGREPQGVQHREEL